MNIDKMIAKLDEFKSLPISAGDYTMYCAIREILLAGKEPSPTRIEVIMANKEKFLYDLIKELEKRVAVLEQSVVLNPYRNDKPEWEKDAPAVECNHLYYQNDDSCIRCGKPEAKAVECTCRYDTMTCKMHPHHIFVKPEAKPFPDDIDEVVKRECKHKPSQPYNSLPDWDCCESAVKHKIADPIEKFIYEHEPSTDDESKKFRQELLSALYFWSGGKALSGK